MPLDPARIRLICLDVDGTLSETDDQYLRRIAPWLTPLAPLFHRDAYSLARWLVYRLDTPGSLIIEGLDRLGLDGLANRLSEAIDRPLSTRRKPSFQMVIGVNEMLQQLQSHYLLSVVSARGRRKTMAFLNHFELTGFFTCIATGQTCRRTKPHPDPILWAARQANVSPSECLMVGDTTIDIRAGKAAGAQTVGVLCGFGQREELLQAGADLVLPRTTDLLNTLLFSERMNFT
jgi:phosphoglycolate phosphatase-like HAD superfamily hydrolase